MRDSPYFQVGEWVELKLTSDPDSNGFYQIANVYFGIHALSDGQYVQTFAYKLNGLENRLFHGTCLWKIMDPATQTFDELMEDLLSR